MGARRSSRDEVLSAYVRERVLEWERSGKTLSELAERAGVARSLPSQIKSGKVGVAGGTADGFARAFGFSSALEMRRAAGGEPVAATVPDRFDLAVSLARADGASEAAIEHVLASDLVGRSNATGGDVYSAIMLRHRLGPASVPAGPLAIASTFREPPAPAPAPTIRRRR